MSKSASTHERVVAVVGEIDGLLDEIRGRAHWVMHVSRLQQELDEVGTLQRAMAQEADLSDEMALDGSELVGVPLDATCGLLQGVVELLSRATDELNQMCGKHQATAKQMATVLLTRRLQRLYRVIHDRAEAICPD